MKMSPATRSKFKALQVGETLVIPWKELGDKKPEGPGTVSDFRRMWKMKPTQDGLVVERVK